MDAHSLFLSSSPFRLPNHVLMSFLHHMFVMCVIPEANLAFMKNAWQGLTLSKGAASRSTDGFSKEGINQGLCTMSGLPAGPPGLGGPWIAVDLGSVVSIAYVVLWLPVGAAPKGG